MRLCDTAAQPNSCTIFGPEAHGRREHGNSVNGLNLASPGRGPTKDGVAECPTYPRPIFVVVRADRRGVLPVPLFPVTRVRRTSIRRLDLYWFARVGRLRTAAQLLGEFTLSTAGAAA
jgi:hypothetical protein